MGELAQQCSNPQEYIRKNVKVLKEHGIKTKKAATKAWKDGNYAKDIKPHEVGVEDAVNTIREKVPSNVFTGWFRDADSTYKGRLEELALADDEVRNAGLNIAYQNYRDFAGGGDISFDEFLDTEIPVYRGKNSENWVEGDDVVSFSFDRRIAEKFGANVTEIKIKPRQTIGSYQTTGEYEILVRRCDVDAPGFQGDSAEASESGNPKKEEIASVKKKIAESDGFSFSETPNYYRCPDCGETYGRLLGERKNRPIRRCLKCGKVVNMQIDSASAYNADDDVDWVTINGTHTPLKDGEAVGGGKLKGKSFKKARSQKKAESKKSSGSTSEPKSAVRTQYKHGYNDMENMALSSESMAASFLITVCGVSFVDAKSYVDSGTAVEEAKKAIERKYEEIGKGFEKCPESQQKFMNMTPEEAVAFASESYAQEIDSTLNRGSHTQHMAQTLGLNAKPRVVSREEFEEIAAKSASGPVFRGVVDNLAAGTSADEIVDMTVNGELTYLGNGVHSDGIYFSTKKSTADGYASGGRGRVMEACFSDEARIVDYESLLAQKSISKISDAGTFALYAGYNAVRVKFSDDEDYLIALDRSALVFCDSRGDSTEGGASAVNGEELAKTFNAFADQNHTNYGDSDNADGGDCENTVTNHYRCPLCGTKYHRSFGERKSRLIRRCPKCCKVVAMELASADGIV